MGRRAEALLPAAQSCVARLPTPHVVLMSQRHGLLPDAQYAMTAPDDIKAGDRVVHFPRKFVKGSLHLPALP